MAGYNGLHTYVQSDSTDMNGGAVRATAVTVANLEFMYAATVEPAAIFEADLANDHLELNMVRGDYIIVTNDSVNGASECVIRWGEEI